MRVRLAVGIALLWFPSDLKASSQSTPVNVPGGTAAIRRLVGLDPNRDSETFFLDLHEALLVGADPRATWSDVPQRRKIISFLEDLADWRRHFHDEEAFSVEQWQTTSKILEWLGFRARRKGRFLEAEPTSEARRQSYLDTLGTNTRQFLEDLKAGKTVAIKVSDELAPLPFGLSAWRDTFDNNQKLSPAEAFEYFITQVPASRMLVALNKLDPETRDTVRGDDTKRGWRMFREILDGFCRYPEALVYDGHKFILPGGDEAEPIWAAIASVSPSSRDREGFLRALFTKDEGKLAYIVQALQRLPENAAREYVLRHNLSPQARIKRFESLYEGIDSSNNSYLRARRERYDFAHLATFLRPSEGLEAFPKSERELSERHRFLVVSNLLRGRPALRDSDVAQGLYSRPERFLPAYGVLEDAPFGVPAVAQKYLRALDRLDPNGGSRAAEVSSGLFQASVELLDQLWRAGSLETEQARRLFSDLLEVPLFSQEGVTPALGEERFYDWLSKNLIEALTTWDKGQKVAARRAQERREEERRDAVQKEQQRIATAATEEKERSLNEALSASEQLVKLLSPVAPVPRDESPERWPPRYKTLTPEELAFEMKGTPEFEQQGPLALNKVLEALRQRVRRVLPREVSLSPAASATKASAAAEPLEPQPEQPASIEPILDLDELMTRALAGPPAPTVLRWNGATYSVDPTTDYDLRMSAFRKKQRSLEDVKRLHQQAKAFTNAIANADLSAAQNAAKELKADPELELAGNSKTPPGEDERLWEERRQVWKLLDAVREMSSPKKLKAISARRAYINAFIAEQDLTALLGHVYALVIGSSNLSSADPGLVRRHAFGKAFSGATKTTIGITELYESGGKIGVQGSLFGLRDALEPLYASRVAYASSSSVPEIRSGLVGPILRMSPARLDDDALRFVTSACRATEEIAITSVALNLDEKARSALWAEVAKDLVPPSRRGLVSEISSEMSPERLAKHLSPSDLYRIGRRVALGEVNLPISIPEPPSVAVAKDAFDRLRKRLGEDGARDRLAEFGPRAASYAGRFHLADIDMPSYEWTAEYNPAQLFSDRLYDLKISVARAVEAAGLKAAILPLVLEGALDKMMRNLHTAYDYDWSSIVRAAQAFGKTDLDGLLDQAVQKGQLIPFSPASEPTGQK